MNGEYYKDTLVIVEANPGVQIENEAEALSPRTPITVRSSVQENESGGVESESSQISSEPRNFRLLSDVYNDTEEIEISDELLLIGVDEPKVV